MSQQLDLSTSSIRTRKLPEITEDVKEYRAQLLKKWSKYRNEQNLQDFKLIDRMANAQKKALDELRFESEELYQQAIQADIGMIPIVCVGPVNTPPMNDYPYIDGDYIDKTKIFQGEVTEPK